MINNHKSVRWRRIFPCCLFFLSITLTLSAQDLLVTGKVTDGNLPISGANILIKNTKNGVVTDFDGRYSITAKPTDILEISYLGYTTLSILIQNRSTINIALQEDTTVLGEVQINAGYYTTTDREKTGSIARITAKEIDKQPVNNPLGAMQGYMSGVNIVQTTGVPGGGYDIQIRGRNFINGSAEPLYVIDGVPISSKSLGSRQVSGEILFGNISPLNSINPNDIQSIEVLKDADATAIYGSRGANGVVLITTKRGSAGGTKFSAQLSSTIGRVTRFLKLLNTEQFLELRREGIVNDGYGPFLDSPEFDFFWPDVKSWDNSRYTDWQKELIGGTAYKNNAGLSISGGSAQTQFLISSAYQKESTVFPGDAHYNKATIHSKINHQSANHKFKLTWSTLYGDERNQLPRTDYAQNAFILKPNTPKLYNAEGNYNWENNTFDNPMAASEEEYYSKINSWTTNALLGFSFTPNLELKSNLGYTIYDLVSHKILPSSARNPMLGYTPQKHSMLTTNNSRRESWIAEPQLEWSPKFDKFKINFLLGVTFQTETTQQRVLKAQGFPNNNLIQNLTAAETIQVLEDANSEYNYQAFFGRVNLNYQDKFLLNLTGRRDGSSRFGPSRQFGNFGAVGAAWIFSQEQLFKNSSALSYGKLRASLGTTGSDNIGDYQFLSTYKVLGYDYNGISALAPSGIFNPIFGWEENKKLEAALELGFLKDRVLFNMGWFRNRSANQLIGIPLPATTGFSELNGNFDATVENTGFEIDLQTKNISTDNLHWTTTFNLTIPRNKLVKFDGLESSTFRNRLIIGQPITIIKLYNSLGVNSDTGFYEFEDYNQDGVINQEDKQWIENLSPDYYGGLGNQISYKNFTLDFFFQFKKQKAFNNFRVNATPGLGFNGTTNLLDRWQKTGDQSLYQRASAGLIGGIGYLDLQQSESNAAVSDGSFIRLRNISINYQLPSIKENLKINIYLQGQNLWTITKYEGPDPEQKSFNILPPLKNITLGVQVAL